jgi:hypothetical protein
MNYRLKQIDPVSGSDNTLDALMAFNFTDEENHSAVFTMTAGVKFEILTAN